MLLPIKPICDHKKVRKDGTSLVFIQYCRSAEEKTLLNTEIAIPPQYWNKKLNRISNKLPVEFGDVSVINKDIQRQIRLAEDIITYALSAKRTNPVNFVKAVYQPNFNLKSLEKVAKENPEEKKKIDPDFFFQLDDYIACKVNTLSESTIGMIKNLRSILMTFQEKRKKKITFEQIDYNFYEEYLHYLQFEHIHARRKQVIIGLKTNTLGKNIKQLIIFLRNRKAKRIISDLDLTGFKILEEDADAIYITPEELEIILKLDLSAHPHLEKYRDLFVFGSLTGLRFSDFSMIKPEDVRDGMMYKKQEKTKHWVVVPLRKEALHIFMNKFNRNVPPVSNAEFNEYIKEIGNLAGLDRPIKHSHCKGNKTFVETRPKYEWITSHTCRRSFCTNEFLAGTPVELIMKISGHKSLKDFYKYIKIAPEQAGQRMKEIWQKRGEIQGA